MRCGMLTSVCAESLLLCAQAKRLLQCAMQGFERAHGKDLSRLKALKGDNCPEFALYARLHLLQGVVALLSGIYVIHCYSNSLKHAVQARLQEYSSQKGMSAILSASTQALIS